MQRQKPLLLIIITWLVFIRAYYLTIFYAIALVEREPHLPTNPVVYEIEVSALIFSCVAHSALWLTLLCARKNWARWSLVGLHGYGCLVYLLLTILPGHLILPVGSSIPINGIVEGLLIWYLLKSKQIKQCLSIPVSIQVSEAESLTKEASPKIKSASPEGQDLRLPLAMSRLSGKRMDKGQKDWETPDNSPSKPRCEDCGEPLRRGTKCEVCSDPDGIARQGRAARSCKEKVERDGERNGEGINEAIGRDLFSTGGWPTIKERNTKL